MTKRRRFTDQFKVKVALEALRGDKISHTRDAEIKELHAKIGRLIIENDSLPQGLKR